MSLRRHVREPIANKAGMTRWWFCDIRLIGFLFLLISALLIVEVASFHIAAGSVQMASVSAPSGEDTHQVYLPLISSQVEPVKTAYRIGFTNSQNALSTYTDIENLRSGWYTNWGVSSQPNRPGNIEYAQMIRVHQKLSCGKWFDRNRETCPYLEPHDYVFKPDAATIKQAAQNNPGAIWLIGNEMDRVDWYVRCLEAKDGVCIKELSDGQDEMLPETYARAYHDLYQMIREADPSAKIASGGLIQPTPLRLQWLSIAWDTYQATYSNTMPVDIWNIHNFILREHKHSYGAAIPPGLPKDPKTGEYPITGEYLADDFTHIDHDIFDKQIRAMRQWMKDRGQQEKPLVITEYGVLYSHTATRGSEQLNFNDPDLVHPFMLWTFDYFLDTKDCEIGFHADDCRLVQRWLWFSLDHAQTDSNDNLVSYFNVHTSLFDAATKNILPAGEKFRDYVLTHIDDLSKLAIQ